jgi:hypothetical protein
MVFLLQLERARGKRSAAQFVHFPLHFNSSTSVRKSIQIISSSNDLNEHHIIQSVKKVSEQQAEYFEHDHNSSEEKLDRLLADADGSCFFKDLLQMIRLYQYLKRR